MFQDVMAHIDALQATARDTGKAEDRRNEVPFHRYEVNLLVDNAGATGAPVVSLALPSLSNLVGKVEHVPLLVTIITDFMFIRPGSLHKANGGFLLIDAMDLLQQDVSWETLKRALREARIKIENLAEILDRSNTVTIQPQPIPLDLKIVLFGEAWLYYRMRELDPDFADQFKVHADFATSADRDDANCGALLRLFASVSRTDGLKQLDRAGAARMIDEAARQAGDAEKISVRTGRLTDLLREADHFAGEGGRSLISADDVGRAVAAREDRAGRLKALEHELVKRRIIFIDTDGAKTGQVNGITVLSTPGFAFGLPARITAQVRPGNGRVTDIERLAEFSGPTHLKGVQILTGLSERSLFDHACAFAVGQRRVRAILWADRRRQRVGGRTDRDPVGNRGRAAQAEHRDHGLDRSARRASSPSAAPTEKIEGFFDICAMRGLAKGNGVIVPKANIVES
jgi:predicted ATP-dependent protease